MTGLNTKWVNAKQQLADCLTKDDAKAGDYLRYVLKHCYLHMVEHPDIEWVLSKERAMGKPSTMLNTQVGG